VGVEFLHRQHHRLSRLRFLGGAWQAFRQAFEKGHRQGGAGPLDSAVMNEYDKASRYFIKRDPSGYFCWQLRRRTAPFHAWIDTRRHTLPDQGDLTNDLVAAFRVGDGFEALCVELQAESEGGSASRLLLGYVPRLLTEPAAAGSLVLSAAGSW